MTESGWCENDIIFICNNLEKWMKDETAQDIPLTNKFLGPKIRKDPLGVVLVIGFVLSKVSTRERFAQRLTILL
jgi:beta-apo-4'-carotenal oxygenase